MPSEPAPPITAAFPLCVGCETAVGEHAFRICDDCIADRCTPVLFLPRTRTVFVPVARPSVWQRLRRWWRA